MSSDPMTRPGLSHLPTAPEHRLRRASTAAAYGFCTLAWLLWAPGAFVSAAWADVPAEARRGAELFKDSAYAEAAEAFRKATIASPDDARWRYDLGLSEALAQEYEEAVNNLQTTAKLATPDLASAALYNAGNVHMATGDFAQAARSFREALLKDPGDREAKHNLELALRELARAQQRPDSSGQGQDSTQNQKQDQDSNSESDQNQKPEDSSEQPDSTGQQKPQPIEENAADSTGQDSPEPNENPSVDSTLSREQAERILRALASEEARLRNQARKTLAVPAPGGKDW